MFGSLAFVFTIISQTSALNFTDLPLSSSASESFFNRNPNAQSDRHLRVYTWQSKTSAQFGSVANGDYQSLEINVELSWLNNGRPLISDVRVDGVLWVTLWNKGRPIGSGPGISFNSRWEDSIRSITVRNGQTLKVVFKTKKSKNGENYNPVKILKVNLLTGHAKVWIEGKGSLSTRTFNSTPLTTYNFTDYPYPLDAVTSSKIWNPNLVITNWVETPVGVLRQEWIKFRSALGECGRLLSGDLLE